jgi:hypothetical protein
VGETRIGRGCGACGGEWRRTPDGAQLFHNPGCPTTVLAGGAPVRVSLIDRSPEGQRLSAPEMLRELGMGAEEEPPPPPPPPEPHEARLRSMFHDTPVPGLDACLDCGAMVLDRPTHLDFHERLEAQGLSARLF